MSDAALLRAQAESQAEALPALMAEAEHLAATVMLGVHGRRRSGMGDEFWQHRPALPGDSARSIDWRRSARSDAQFVQEKEWQAAQSVLVWSDPARSMAFSSAPDLPTKAQRARLLALAMVVLLVRGDERVAVVGADPHPRRGEAQIARIADEFVSAADTAELGVPDTTRLPARGRAVLLSDFFADPARIRAALGAAADRGVRGVLVQVLDPQEESFPFEGRTIFESMGRTIRHETLKAGGLRARYLERLAERKSALGEMARETGWQYLCHHTSGAASAALLWMYAALEQGRR